MAYIYCDSCCIGFHSNVHTCPECGRPVRRTYEADAHPHRRSRRANARALALREDVENEVREAIYGWHSGTVEPPEAIAPHTD